MTKSTAANQAPPPSNEPQASRNSHQAAFQRSLGQLKMVADCSVAHFLLILGVIGNNMKVHQATTATKELGMTHQARLKKLSEGLALARSEDNPDAVHLRSDLTGAMLALGRECLASHDGGLR
jgi:hypothetical protein